jgi:type I restriction enzyme, S subunit
MSDPLPINWEQWRLADVGEWFGGGTPSSSNPGFWNGNIPWVSPKDMKVANITSAQDRITVAAVQNSAVKLISTGSVLFVTRSGILAHSFPVATTKVQVTVNQDLKAITPVEVVNHDYLAWLLRAFERQILTTCSKHGTTVHSIEIRSLKELLVPVPPPTEQRRIVMKVEELFSELDKGVESLKTARERLKAYRQAVLKHAFEGKLTADWRKQYPGNIDTACDILVRINSNRRSFYADELKKWTSGKASKPKSVGEAEAVTADELAKLTVLPAEWRWVHWSDVISFENGAFRRGPFGSTLKKEIFVKQSDYKVYEQYCPINDDCSYERYYISEDLFRELEGFSVRAGDFLISCSGVTLGRITQVPRVHKKGVINQALLRVRINDDFYDLAFFKHLFRSSYFQRKVFDNSTGTAIPNVKGVNELKAIPVPLCSIEEQREIVRKIEMMFSFLDRFEVEIDLNLKKSDALRQAILKSAFSGKLVAQDFKDEPASVLLERIRAKRKRATAKQPRNNKNDKEEAA